MATDKKSPQEALNDIISTPDRSSTNQRYNNWPETYESDMHAVLYFGPTKLMEEFEKLNVPKDAKILDVCAGTGAVGRELVKRGYTNLHAIDGSENMLAKAKEEGNYETYTYQLFEPDTKMPFESCEFDCVLLAGVFAPGHLPIAVLREVCRVTKQGGVVSWICCDPAYYEDKDEQYANGGFYKVVDELEEKGCWKKHDGFPVPVKPYIEYSDGFIMAYDVVGTC